MLFKGPAKSHIIGVVRAHLSHPALPLPHQVTLQVLKSLEQQPATPDTGAFTGEAIGVVGVGAFTGGATGVVGVGAFTGVATGVVGVGAFTGDATGVVGVGDFTGDATGVGGLATGAVGD